MDNKILKYSLLFFLIFPVSIYAQKNLYLQAKINFEQNKYNLAANELQQYENNFHNDINALVLSGKIYIELKQYDRAITNLLNVSSKKNPEINLLLARAYAGKKDVQNAIFSLDKYLKQKNKLSEDKLTAFPEFGNIADTQEWQNLWANNRYSKKEMMIINAKYFYELGKYNQAENVLNNFVIKYGAQPEVLFIKAKISIVHNNYKDALSYLEKAVLLSDNVKYLNAKAELEYSLKKYSKALKSYNEALQKDSLNLALYKGRSLVYSAINEPDKAMSDMQKYLLYYPDNELAIKQYAQIAFVGKDYLTAIRNYSKLIEKHPEKTEYFKLRAEAYMKTHTYAYAVKDYSMALDLYPRDAEIYYQKGIAHFKLKQIDKACSAWKHAAKYGNEKSKQLIYKYCR